MKRGVWIGSMLVVGLISGLVGSLRAPEVQAQRTKPVEIAWEYRVVILSYYNPGDDRTDERRAARFEKLLNLEAKQGWEPASSLMSRTNVQTIGGGVSTLDTSAFVALRRAKR